MKKSGFAMRKTQLYNKDGSPKKPYNSRGVRRCTSTAYVSSIVFSFSIIIVIFS